MTEDGKRLGSWVANQKTKWQTLSGEKQQCLVNLAGWTRNAANTHWEEGYERLVSYAEENGNTLVKPRYEVEGFKLGQWVVTQRARWYSLPGERQAKLRAMPGWTVSVHDTRWEEAYLQLEYYVDQNGHASPPQTYANVSGFKLGTWVAGQRQGRAKGRLSEDRCKRLAALPGWVWNAGSWSRD